MIFKYNKYTVAIYFYPNIIIFLYTYQNINCIIIYIILNYKRQNYFFLSPAVVTLYYFYLYIYLYFKYTRNIIYL